MRSILAAVLFAISVAVPVAAQQKIGFVDSDRVLQQLPEYNTVSQDLDRLASQWQQELDALDAEAEALRAEYAARELLYTDAERERKIQEIEDKVTEREALRRRYFSPDGELFREQQNRLRPVQERVLTAIEAVAEDEGYDFVFDRTGDLVFLYTRPRHDLTQLVLDELGVGVGLNRQPGTSR
ncbi:MAG: OmpH family outer membrane protein [Bacteroidota bacterium]